jgi:molybdopterin converting factor small subunit
MQVNILLFGKLAEITGSKNITIENVQDTDQLLKQLNTQYPGLSEATFLVAVDKQVISGNTVLKDKNMVALLPPYAGG